MQTNTTSPIIGTLELPATFTVSGTQDKRAMSITLDKAWLLEKLNSMPILFHSLLHTLNASFVSRGVSDLFAPFYEDEEIAPTEEQILDFLLMRCGPPDMKLGASADDLVDAQDIHNRLSVYVAAGRGEAGCRYLAHEQGIFIHERSTVDGIARYLAAKRKWVEWKIAQESGPTAPVTRAKTPEEMLAELDAFEPTAEAPKGKGKA
jgi:hypothetical protein